MALVYKLQRELPDMIREVEEDILSVDELVEVIQSRLYDVKAMQFIEIVAPKYVEAIIK